VAVERKGGRVMVVSSWMRTGGGSGGWEGGRGMESRASRMAIEKVRLKA
jgi:hypothetical protein